MERMAELQNGNLVSIREAAKDSFVVEYIKKDPENGLAMTATVIMLSREALAATAVIAVRFLQVEEDK